MTVLFQYLLLLIGLLPLATAGSFTHEVRQVGHVVKPRDVVEPRDVVKPRHDDGGQWWDFWNAFGGDNDQTTVTEVLQQTVTATATASTTAAPVTVTLNRTIATTASANAKNAPFSFLTTTVFSSGAGPTQTVSLLPDTVTQTVYVTMPCANNPALASTNTTQVAASTAAASASSASVSVAPVSSSAVAASSSSAAPISSTLASSSALESALTLGIGTSTTPAAVAAAGVDSAASLTANNPAAVTPAPAVAAPSSSNAPNIDTSGLTLMTALSLGNLAQQTVVPALA